MDEKLPRKITASVSWIAPLPMRPPLERRARDQRCYSVLSQDKIDTFRPKMFFGPAYEKQTPENFYHMFTKPDWYPKALTWWQKLCDKIWACRFWK
jgi:hypothetical protein